MDYKTEYSRNVNLSRELAGDDEDLQKKISSGQFRKERFAENWQTVNINLVIDRFAPGARAVQVDGKIYFSGDDRRYAVIADIGGGYLRIYDLQRKEYTDLNGQSVRNYTDERGRQHGRSRSEYNAMTHFLIRKREDI